MFNPEPIPALPLTIAQAIARVEGWYTHGPIPNRGQRNNNPGNLELTAFTEKYGATLETGHPVNRFAVFPDAETGWRALNDLLASHNYTGLTVEQIVAKFAPASENNTEWYVRLVTRWSMTMPNQILRA